MTRFQLEPYHRNVSERELLGDIKRVATEVHTSTVSIELYRTRGRYSPTTIVRRFGSWNAALERADLAIAKRSRISTEALFENLAQLWIALGRQPRRSELNRKPSTISSAAYERRFGTWRSALSAFVEYANADGTARDNETVVTVPPAARTGPRTPTLRLRFAVMRRDSFACRHCGASPAKTPNVELHVDHVIPWSAGGQTILGNLQTLCSSCNLGKGRESDGEA